MEALEQPVGRSLSGRGPQDAGYPAPDHRVEGRVEQRVEELARGAGGRYPEGRGEVREEVVPGQEPDDVGDEAGVEGLVTAENPSDPLGIPREQIRGHLHERIGRGRWQGRRDATLRRGRLRGPRLGVGAAVRVVVAFAQALLQGIKVVSLNAPKQGQGQGSRGCGEGDEHAIRHPGRQTEHHHHGPAAGRRPHPVEPDVDDDLRRALPLPRQRSVEELVGRAEERVAKHGLGPAEEDGGPEAREGDDEQPTQGDDGGLDGQGAREPQPGQGDAGEGCLYHQREQADHRVEEREERHELRAPREGRLRARVEHVVHERLHEGAQADDEGEVAEVGEVVDQPQAGGVALGLDPAPAHGLRGSKPEQRRETEDVQGGHGEEHGGDGHGGRGLPGDQAPDRSAQARGGSDRSHRPFGRVGIEPLVHQGPEPGHEGRAEERGVKVDGHGGQAWGGTAQGPLSREQGGARPHGEGHHARRRQRRHPPGEGEHRQEGEQGGRRRHQGQGGNVELGKEEGVARRLARDLLGDQQANRVDGGPDGRGDEASGPFGHVVA